MANNKRRLPFQLAEEPAVEVTRTSPGHERVVYVLVQDKKHKYPFGKSRIVFIGTSKNVPSKMAGSAGYWSRRIFRGRNVNHFEARILTCPTKRGVKTWLKLERALLLTFRELYGVVPKFNMRDLTLQERDEFEYFVRERLVSAIREELV